MIIWGMWFIALIIVECFLILVGRSTPLLSIGETLLGLISIFSNSHMYCRPYKTLTLADLN